MFAKLWMWIKLFMSYYAGESAQKTTDHNAAIAAANTAGLRIDDAQNTPAPANNADLVKQLREAGGL